MPYLAGLRPLIVANTNFGDLHLTLLCDDSAPPRVLNTCACLNMHPTSCDGLYSLIVAMCTQSSVPDKAFEDLHRIYTLIITHCRQTAITDKAFENLRGIHTLGMAGCRQEIIADYAFESLCGIHIMSNCNHTAKTAKAFTLRGLRTLTMAGCTQSTTDNAFENLR